MKTTWLTILCWTYIRLSTSFPVDDRPAFTPWDLAKREIEAAIFSNPLGPQFGVPDETCRGTLEGPNTGSCWKMADVTVDKFIANRKPEANECEVPCLFYTSKLTGAAERLANFVLKEVLLTGAAEGPRKYQTIWELHPPKFYPNKNDLDKTPEAKCIYQDQRDQDYDANFDGCQRLYFKSMSKAMAMECKGEVFLMTNSDLSGTRPEGKKEKVPVDGIWWQVEFPTLIDDARPADKKITKISYLQVPFKDLGTLTAEERSKPPKIEARGEYWPNGVGNEHLQSFRNEQSPQSTPSPQTTPTPTPEAANPVETPTSGLVRRADRTDEEVLEPDDEGYPYHYSIDEIYDWYKEAAW